MTRPAYPFHYSELTTAQHCPKKYEYKYVNGLRRKRPTLPLARGTWVHFGLELAHVEKGTREQTLLARISSVESPAGWRIPVAHLIKRGWREILDTALTNFWNTLDDESKAAWTEDGEALPNAVLTIVDEWLFAYAKVFKRQRVLLVEHEWRRDWGEGKAQGKLDLLRELDGFVDLVDWKTIKKMPDTNFQLMDGQRLWYVWGVLPLLEEHSLEIHRVCFMYIHTKLPAHPEPLKSGEAFKRNHGPATPRSWTAAMRKHGFKLDQPAYNGDSPTNREMLTELHRTQTLYVDRFLPIVPGAWNATAKDMAAASHFADELHEGRYPWRNISYMCKGCEFADLCRADQWGEATEHIIDSLFENHDPYTDEDHDEPEAAE